MKWEEKSDRIKQVRVQEEIFHKKKASILQRAEAEVRYSPLLRQKSIHRIRQQDRRSCALAVQSTSSCSDSSRSGLVVASTGPRQTRGGGGGWGGVTGAGCNTPSLRNPGKASWESRSC